MNKTRTRIGLLAALVAVCWFTVWGLDGATPDVGPTVTFTATGTFSTPPVSGSDTLKLAGEPFTINIVANAGDIPIKHGPNWAVFSPLKMTGVVHSGLLGTSPINVASGGASIMQAVGPDYDPVETAFPVKVVGISLTINAQFTLPGRHIGEAPDPPVLSRGFEPQQRYGDVYQRKRCNYVDDRPRLAGGGASRRAAIIRPSGFRNP